MWEMEAASSATKFIHCIKGKTPTEGHYSLILGEGPLGNLKVLSKNCYAKLYFFVNKSTSAVNL